MSDETTPEVIHATTDTPAGATIRLRGRDTDNGWIEAVEVVTGDGDGDGDGGVLGDCPDCDGTVVEDGDRAVCTDCDLWCWMAQWETYYSETNNESDTDPQ